MSNKQPEELRLADRIDLKDYYEFDAELHCPKAAAELRRLHAATAELLEDAARYRWLRTQDNDDFEFAVIKTPHFDVFESAEQLDDAIDAAIAKHGATE